MLFKFKQSVQVTQRLLIHPKKLQCPLGEITRWHFKYTQQTNDGLTQDREDNNQHVIPDTDDIIE